MSIPNRINGALGATPSLVTQEIIPITDPAVIAAATGYPLSAIPPSLYEGPFETAYLQQTDPNNQNAAAFRYVCGFVHLAIVLGRLASNHPLHTNSVVSTTILRERPRLTGCSSRTSS